MAWIRGGNTSFGSFITAVVFISMCMRDGCAMTGVNISYQNLLDCFQAIRSTSYLFHAGFDLPLQKPIDILIRTNIVLHGKMKSALLLCSPSFFFETSPSAAISISFSQEQLALSSEWRFLRDEKVDRWRAWTPLAQLAHISALLLLVTVAS